MTTTSDPSTATAQTARDMQTSAHRRWRIGGVCAAAVAAAGVSVAVATASPEPADTTGNSAVSEVTTKTGVLTIEETGTDGNPVPGAVIQIERVATSAYGSSSTSASASPAATTTTETTTSASSSAALATSPPADTADRSDETALSLPVGIKFDIVTTSSPIILAVPEGNYVLTHLGLTGTTTSSTNPSASPGKSSATDAAAPAPTPAQQTVTVGDHQRTKATLTTTPTTTSTTPSASN